MVFFGTPDFAVASLDALIKTGVPVVGVVTAPDRPAGRGLSLVQSPVKKYARGHHLPLLQPETLKSPDFLHALKELNPDIQVVVAFRMLPVEVWGLPRLGTINLHASLLPQYRGAAPINRAIMNGARETGVTTFFINEEIDTGAILLQQSLEIGPDETAGQLHDRLMVLGAALVVKTVEGLAEGGLRPRPQEDYHGSDRLLPAPKLKKQDTFVTWDLKTPDVYNQIRGLSPYPGAIAEIPLKSGSRLPVKLGMVRPVVGCSLPENEPGKLVTDRKHHLRFATLDGFIEILEIQPASKKMMKISEFLNGFGDHIV